LPSASTHRHSVEHVAGVDAAGPRKHQSTRRRGNPARRSEGRGDLAVLVDRFTSQATGG
jgi:hypothetical protein